MTWEDAPSHICRGGDKGDWLFVALQLNLVQY